MVCQS